MWIVIPQYIMWNPAASDQHLQLRYLPKFLAQTDDSSHLPALPVPTRLPRDLMRPPSSYGAGHTPHLLPSATTLMKPAIGTRAVFTFI